MPRQELPTVYYQNACIDVFRSSVVLEKHSMSGDVILGYEMTENFDIDTEEDFGFEEHQYENNDEEFDNSFKVLSHQSCFISHIMSKIEMEEKNEKQIIVK